VSSGDTKGYRGHDVVDQRSQDLGRFRPDALVIDRDLELAVRMLRRSPSHPPAQSRSRSSHSSGSDALTRIHKDSAQAPIPPLRCRALAGSLFIGLCQRHEVWVANW
jgi:hypothetical protein